MKYCKKCNITINEDVKFCEQCGSKLEENKPVYENEVNNREFKQVNKNGKLKGKSYILTVILVLVLVLIAGLGIVFYKPILKNYYVYKGNEAIGNEKIEYYVSAMKYSDDKELEDKLYEILKQGDFESNIKAIENSINAKKYKGLSVRYYLEKVDRLYDRGEYEEAYSYLEKLENLGYNKADYKNYSEIEKEVNKETISDDYNREDEVDKSDSDNGEFVINDSHTRFLTKQELSRLSKDELAIARNEIFARHGYVFETEPFVSHFKGKSWYKMNPDFKGGIDELNEIEKANVELIKSLENQEGIPQGINSEDEAIERIKQIAEIKPLVERNSKLYFECNKHTLGGENLREPKDYTLQGYSIHIRIDSADGLSTSSRGFFFVESKTQMVYKWDLNKGDYFMVK